MQIKKLITGRLLSITSLSVLALIDIQQAQTNSFKAFMTIVLVALTLGVITTYQT